MAFRSRVISTVARGFRSSSRVLGRRFAANYSRSFVAPLGNLPVALFSTAANDSEKKEMSPEEAKKMASEMLFNEKDLGDDKKDGKEEKETFVPPQKEEGAVEEQHEFQAETKQLLDIVTNSIYTDKEVFLRELISNASDALEKLRHEQVSGMAVNDKDLPLEIRIYTDEKNGTITIQDTGIGMTKKEMEDNLGVIARSGSKAFLKKATDEGKAGDLGTSLIGHFGVGFYAAFMVADHVDVYSHSASDNETYCWSSDGAGDYKITKASSAPRGTTIVLHLKPDQKKFAIDQTVNRIIKKYSNFVNHPIRLNGKEVNTVHAIWAMDKNSITEQQYLDFYHFVGQGWDTPLFRLHFSADAPIALQALFYVGSMQTEKMGLGRMEPGVSLYSRKVLIESHSKNLLPDWMRFVYGVVDSEDIPLSLSRENMQDSLLMKRIRKILTKKFLRFLHDKSTKERDQYLTFYNEFNPFLKEGVIQDYDNRQDLASILMFESSKCDASTLTTLDEYIKRMPESQKEIYYLNSTSRSLAQASPYYEVFKRRGLEVLFLYNPVDDFVMTNVREYKGKRFVSVENAEIDLSAEETKKDEPTPTQQVGLTEQAAAELAAWMKTSLGEKVKDVKVTHRLVTSPAIVTDSNNAGYRRMVKMMQAARGDLKGLMPLEPMVLEVNPHHDLLVKLNEIRASKPLLAQCVTEQLFDDCLVSAGLMDDSRTMIPRLNALLYAALGGEFKLPQEVVSLSADEGKKDEVVSKPEESKSNDKTNESK